MTTTAHTTKTKNNEHDEGLETKPRIVHPLYDITPEGYDLLCQSALIQRPLLPADTEWVNGCTGPRGGGKSIMMTYLACHDYLLRGKPVWSNIPIKVELALPNREVVTAESMPLDPKSFFTLSDELTGGLVCIDELQLYAEARRSQSTKNVLLSYVIMQTRKRGLSFFFTIQQSRWMDNRLQFMADVMMRCRDIAFTPWGFENDITRGNYFSISVEDWSGMLTGRLYSETGESQTFCLWGRPIWGMFNSYDVIDVFEALTPIDLALTRMKISTGSDIDEESKKVGDIMEKLTAARMAGEDIIKDRILWQMLNIPPEGRREAGKILKDLGVFKRQRNDGWYYVIPEEF